MEMHTHQQLFRHIDTVQKHFQHSVMCLDYLMCNLSFVLTDTNAELSCNI